MKLRFTSHGDERKFTRKIGASEIKKCIRQGSVKSVGGLKREYSYKGIHVVAELIIDGYLIITCFVRSRDRENKEHYSKNSKKKVNSNSENKELISM